MSQLIDKLKKLGASSLEIEAIIYSDDINKSLSEFYKKSLEEDLFKAKAAVGEIREWKGIKYQKQSDGSWKPIKKQNPSKDRIFIEKKESSLFGENFPEYQNKPKAAIEFLFSRERGQVIGAYNREDLGKIDIVWGNNASGLCHIKNKHFTQMNDFNSLKDLTNKIVDLLKEGKIVDTKDQSKVKLVKGKFALFLKRTLIYDEEDNFEEKVWVLTSYNTKRDEEDKIRKATSNEIAFEEKDQTTFLPCSSSVNPRKGHLEKAQPPVAYPQCSFSERKDTLKKSLEQQLMRAFLNKRDNISR